MVAPGGTNPNIGIFYGKTSSDTLIWSQADSRVIQGTGSSYNCFFDSLNWINCDYFYNNTNTKTNVRISLPSGYTKKSIKVFISFDGLNAVTIVNGYSGGY